MLVLPISQSQGILTLLDDSTATAGPWEGALVHLFKNDLVPAPNTVLADFTEADFDGYAASAAIVWGDPYQNELNQSTILGDAKTFTATGATTPNDIYGYYITDAGGTELLLSERFAEVQPMPAAGAVTIVIPRVTIGLAA